MTNSEILRREIERSGLPVAVIAVEARIPQPTLSRFVNGKDLRLTTADKLAAYFGLELMRPAGAGPVAAKKKPTAKKSKK